jgi:hypothetical protein
LNNYLLILKRFTHYFINYLIINIITFYISGYTNITNIIIHNTTFTIILYCYKSFSDYSKIILIKLKQLKENTTNLNIEKFVDEKIKETEKGEE